MVVKIHIWDSILKNHKVKSRYMYVNIILLINLQNLFLTYLWARSDSHLSQFASFEQFTRFLFFPPHKKSLKTRIRNFEWFATGKNRQDFLTVHIRRLLKMLWFYLLKNIANLYANSSYYQGFAIKKDPANHYMC